MVGRGVLEVYINGGSTDITLTSCRSKWRPITAIGKEQLEAFLKLKIPLSDIASALHVSRPTVYKAIRDYNINYKRFSDASEAEIRQAVEVISRSHPNAGESIVMGHLRARGFHVQRSRVRSAIHHNNPNGPMSRFHPPIRRRVYSVPCPNYVWHIDGNHKLVRWRMVLHHAVDGYSRLVVFGACSTNNRASTVLQLYHQAVRKYGRPFRVRTDHGGENVDVWRDMIQAWGEEARSVIVGSSVHNQRVERHNRAANEQELSVFREEFYQLESEGLLDPLNETDLFCLHYVYLPRINRSISEFIAAHNNHAVSTENNQTPAQMFYLNLPLTAFHGGFPEDVTWRGVSVNDLMSPDLPHVQVPETRNPLTEADTVVLRNTIDPLSTSNGKELYIQTLRFVGIRLQQN